MWMVPAFTVGGNPTLMAMTFLTVMLLQLADKNRTVPVGNVSTDLSAVMVQTRCAAATKAIILNVTAIEGYAYYVIEGTLLNGCKTTSFTPVNRFNNGTWFGWTTSGAPFECVNGINPSETLPPQEDLERLYHPATFTFFKNPSMYTMILCYSVLTEHVVAASFNLDPEHGKLFNVSSRNVVRPLGYGPNG